MKARLSLLVSLVVGLAAAGAAQAHVTVHPNALPAGGFTVVAINVPNEEANAATTKVDVQFPDGVYSASPSAMAGWRAQIITKKLPKPVEIEPGFSVSTRVDRIVFSGGRIPPNRFLAFPVSILVPRAKPGTLLTFKAVQTYSSGKIARWIGAPSSEEPAPQVLVRSATSAVLDYPAGAGTAKQSMGHVMKGFAVALPLGGLAVYLALRRLKQSA
jgi:uncharacterized protein YcnI